MEKDKKKGVILLVICIVIGIIMISAGLYFLFFKKDDKPIENNDNNPPTEEISQTKIELIVDEFIQESEKTIQLGNGYYDFKLVATNENKSELYLNNEKIETLDYTTAVVYLVDRYLIVGWEGAQAGTLTLGYVDETGTYYNIYPKKEIYNIYFESGFMYGNVEDPTKEDFDTKIVEVLLNGNNVTIKDVNND